MESLLEREKKCESGKSEIERYGMREIQRVWERERPRECKRERD